MEFAWLHSYSPFFSAFIKRSAGLTQFLPFRRPAPLEKLRFMGDRSVHHG